jgi:hypothetical protein
MNSNVVTAHVLSAQQGKYGGRGDAVAWIFGVALEQEIDGHTQWIIETADEDVIAQLRAAYIGKTPTGVRRELFVDPAINAVD